VLNSIVGWMSTVGEWSRVEGGAVNPTGDTFPVEGLVKDTVTIFGQFSSPFFPFFVFFFFFLDFRLI